MTTTTTITEYGAEIARHTCTEAKRQALSDARDIVEALGHRTAAVALGAHFAVPLGARDAAVVADEAVRRDPSPHGVAVAAIVWSLARRSLAPIVDLAARDVILRRGDLAHTPTIDEHLAMIHAWCTEHLGGEDVVAFEVKQQLIADGVIRV